MYYGSGTGGHCCICAGWTLRVHSPDGRVFCVKWRHRRHLGSQNPDSLSRCVFYTYRTILPNFIPSEIQESHAIAESTARCRCKYRYVSNFKTTLCGFSATASITEKAHKNTITAVGSWNCGGFESSTSRSVVRKQLRQTDYNIDDWMSSSSP